MLVLVGCSQASPVATPSARPAQLPILPSQSAKPAAPTAQPRGTSLPGRLAFAAAGNIWLWQGEQAQQLTNAGDAAQPALSPDGTQIAFVLRRPSASNIALLPVAGGEIQILTDYESAQPIGSLERIYESMWAFYPSFAPDGKQLIFTSQGGPPAGSPASEYRLSLFALPLEQGAQRRQIFAELGISAGRAIYTPDGSAVIFVYQPNPPEASQIYRLDLATEQAAPLASIPEQSYDPAISADAQLLAYAKRVSGGTTIFVQPIAAGNAVQLQGFLAARAPAFSPDGKQIAFLAAQTGERGFDLWVAALQRDQQGALSIGTPQRITTDMMIDADSGISWK